MRLFPHDVPSREPFMRRVVVRVRLDNNNYILDSGDGYSQIGYWYGGSTTFNPGDAVIVSWDPAACTFLIRGASIYA